MTNWYECNIKYDKLDDYGNLIKVNEKVLVYTENFSQVESKINDNLGSYAQGLVIGNIKKVHYEDVIVCESKEYWFKAKVVFKEQNENGKEKKSTKTFIISANNFLNATTELDKLLDTGYIADTYIYSLSLTNITEIID